MYRVCGMLCPSFTLFRQINIFDGPAKVNACNTNHPWATVHPLHLVNTFFGTPKNYLFRYQFMQHIRVHTSSIHPQSALSIWWKKLGSRFFLKWKFSFLETQNVTLFGCRIHSHSISVSLLPFFHTFCILLQINVTFCTSNTSPYASM